MESLFGRYEAAALLAVERANGGELAPLEQVIVAFEQLFGTSVTASTFTESLSLLIDARLIDWSNGGLELSYEGRKTIRRSGMHSSPDFPDKVAEKLAELDEDDLAPEGELPAPTEHEVAEAMAALGRGQLTGDVPVPGLAIPPSRMAGYQTIGARLFAGLPAGIGLSLDMPGAQAPAPPAAAAPAGAAGLPLVPPVAYPPVVSQSAARSDAGDEAAEDDEADGDDADAGEGEER